MTPVGVTVAVHDPLMNPIEASLGIFGEGKALIEMASASGLTLIPVALRNPLTTTTL